MKKLPIGISDFKKTRQENYYYIDKSLLIEEVVEADAEILLIPRPRRFGKTLNMSMLYYFFTSDHTEVNEALFEHLKIRNSKIWSEFGKYPVIFLSFKDLKLPTLELALESLNRLLQEPITSFLASKHAQGISLADQRYLEELLSLKASQAALADFFKNFSRILATSFGQQVIILIDEYDTPILTAREYQYESEMLAFMRNFMSGGLKDNPHIYKGVITGILRVAKESIFSGLNNIETFSILNYSFADKFGLTEVEVSQLLKDYHLEDKQERVTHWYNGYQFGQCQGIYNPWSLINYVKKHQEGLKPYWVNTSTNQLVGELLRKVSPEVQEQLMDFLQRKTVVAYIEDHTVFQDLHAGKAETIYGLLLFNGYLTADKVEYEATGKIKCSLRVPNTEVNTVFYQFLERYLDASKTVYQSEIVSTLIHQRAEAFQEALSEYLLHAFSYFDVSQDDRSMPEKVYHGFILGLMAHLYTDYVVKSNPETGLGRADLVIYPRDPQNTKGWLFEFKKKARYMKESLEELAEKAMLQIEESKYNTLLREQGKSQIMKIGVAFDGKKVVCNIVKDE